VLSVLHAKACVAFIKARRGGGEGVRIWLRGRREGASCTKIGDLPGYFHNPMYPPSKDFENYYTVHLWFH